MKNSSLLSLNTYASDEASSSDSEKTDKRGQISCLSKSLLDVNKRVSSSTFSFSLISYLKEPIEESHLSDYELEQTDSIFSCSAQVKRDTDLTVPTEDMSELEQTRFLPGFSTEARKDSVNNLKSNFRKSVKRVSSMSELEQTRFLPGFSTEAKKDSANKLKPSFKKSVKRVSSMSELDPTTSLPSSPVKVKEDKDALSNLKKPIEVICLSDTDQEQADSSSNSPAKNQKDTSTCSFSLIPYFKAANFLPEFELNKNDSFGEQGLNENLSETNSKVHDESIQSSFQNTPVNGKKESPIKKNLENFSEKASLSKCSLNDNKSNSLVSNEYLNISDCEESLEEGQCVTDDDSLKAAKQSCFVEFPQVFDVPVSSIPLPTSKDVHTSTYSMTKGDCSTPILKRSRFKTEEDASTPSLKRRYSTSKEDLSTPSLKKSNLIIEYDTVEDNRDVSMNLSKSSLSIPPPPPPSSEGLSVPISFYKMFPPPSLKRTHSMTEEEDSVNNNGFAFERSTGHHKSYNVASSNLPILRGRRSLPAKHEEDFSSSANNSTFHSSTCPSRHSTGFLSETPKRKFHDSSRRHSYHDKKSYRSCNTDQTPYSPADSYRRHKRFRPDLPYYNIEELSTFQSDVGFIDTHCHLDFLFQRIHFGGSFEDFQQENKDTFPVCFKGCVAVFCNPHSFKRKHFWQDFLEEKNVWASFGCHPHSARDYDDEIEESLLRALDHDKVRAFGEIGLDYSNRNSCPKDIQQRVFMRQLKIALDKKLPLVIHCRDAHDDCLDIMKRVVPKNYSIHLHCFSDTWDLANKWLQEFPNLYIGLTNLVTFPSAAAVHEVAKKISLSRLLLETDAPYFVPRQLARHHSNLNYSHPGMAIHVAAQIAALKGGIPLELVLHKTRQNTKAVYKI